MSNNENASFKIPTELKDELTYLCKIHRRSMSQEILVALDYYIQYCKNEQTFVTPDEVRKIISEELSRLMPSNNIIGNSNTGSNTITGGKL